MKLDRSPHVQHRGRWRTPRLPLAPGPVLCPQQQLRASSLSVTIFLLLLHHRPRPQVSGPPSGLTSSTLPLHSRQSSCIQASPTPWGHTYWRLCPACLRDHVHMLQACSSSNNKTHACWKPALGPTVLTQLPRGVGSMHAGRKSVSISLQVSPPGSLVLPREVPLGSHAPGSPRACSGALPPPYCPRAPWPCQPPSSAPAPQRPATPLLSSTPRDPCLKPPLTSSSCDSFTPGLQPLPTG